MSFALIISILLAPPFQAFVEPLQPRDSILVADQFRYGVELKDVPEGTPVALPEIKADENSPLQMLGTWQLDSTRVSRRKETPARYDIKASLLFTTWMGGRYELPPVPVLVDGDTLVFNAPAEPLVVTEPSIDMENFQLHDIKPQVKFPYTLKEVLPWALGIWFALLLLAGLLGWYFGTERKRKEAAALAAEPPHVRALRKLDKLRGSQGQQKAFYSGVTDALREYMAARYGVGAMEMTTAEIFQDLKKTDIPADLYEEMKTLFEQADFVKFAKYTAPEEETARVLPQAVRFVTATYEQEIAGQAGNDGDQGVMPGPDGDKGVMPGNDGDQGVMPGSDRASQKKED